MLLNIQTGPQTLTDGATPPVRGGKQGDIIVSELHGRFYEQVYRGNTFSTGSTALTALSATTIGLTITSTPIIGVWNPTTSTVNLVILQAMLATGINAAATTGPGAFVWASSIGNSAISTGSAPFNRKTLQLSGSQAKAFNFSVALTGLTNNLVIFESADFSDPTIITTAAVSTAIQTPTVVGRQNFDGSLIVPPGGVLALLNTVSTTTVSAYARLLWEEVAL